MKKKKKLPAELNLSQGKKPRKMSFRKSPLKKPTETTGKKTFTHIKCLKRVQNR